MRVPRTSILRSAGEKPGSSARIWTDGRRLDDVDRRLPFAQRQVALADLQGLLEQAVELGLEAGDQEQGFEPGGHLGSYLSLPRLEQRS